MAQRTSSHTQTVSTVGWVKTAKQKAEPPLNDNDRLPLSGLRFRAQKARLKRAADLSWQVRFAMMKLHHWPDLDNPNWTPLDKFLKGAQSDLEDLGPV